MSDIGTPDRRSAILRAATIGFGSFGVRGSSLRDIATEAGVSLTLLNHHFGSKSSLLKSGVDAHRKVCIASLFDLKLTALNPEIVPSIFSLVNSWVDYEFSLYGTREKSHYLRLITRLNGDPDVDHSMRVGLYCAEPFVREGIQRVDPRLDDASVAAAWMLASGALYACILNFDEATVNASLTPMASVSSLTADFSAHGLNAFLASWRIAPRESKEV